MMLYRVSDPGLDDIETREGRVYTVYPDPKWGWGVPTVGVGHTGPDVRRGDTWTEAQVNAALHSDISSREDVINDMCRNVTLLQNQVDAVGSWGFNVGTGAMRSSTLMHKLAAGDIAGASAEFPKWNIPDILIGRRAGERAQFDGGFVPGVHDAPATFTTADMQRILGVPVDGVFGKVTLHELLAFQKVHGLVVDGIVGPKTIEALKKIEPPKSSDFLAQLGLGL